VLVSRKVVWGDPCTEVSETTKVGADEQELDMRHVKSDKIASRYCVCKILQSKINKTHNRDRFSSDQPKDICLTGGGLELGSVS